MLRKRTHCIMSQQTSQYKYFVYIAFGLKAPLFKGGWGGSDLPRELRAIAHIRRKGSIIILPRLDPFFGDGTSNLLIFLPLLN
jgi:hypothetical protein